MNVCMYKNVGHVKTVIWNISWNVRTLWFIVQPSLWFSACELTRAKFRGWIRSFSKPLSSPILEGGAPSTWVDPAGSPTADRGDSTTTSSASEKTNIAATEQRWPGGEASRWRAAGWFKVARLSSDGFRNAKWMLTTKSLTSRFTHNTVNQYACVLKLVLGQCTSDGFLLLMMTQCAAYVRQHHVIRVWLVSTNHSCLDNSAAVSECRTAP